MSRADVYSIADLMHMEHETILW